MGLAILSSFSADTQYLLSAKDSYFYLRCGLYGAESLTMHVGATLNRNQYNITDYDKARFPSYSVIQAAKSECYSHKESMIVAETFVEVKLQALLDRTAAHLLEAQK